VEGYCKVKSESLEMQGIEEFNYNITTGSGKARVGTNQASGSLVINNGATSTIRGEVSSGKIEIEN
jgi:formylmethanofuran dehydrogenase subunit C